ncbi:MAG: FAD-dependent monooxygenase, partial [Myxococcales bacterium]
MTEVQNTSPAVRHVIIAGAGIGGLTLACALARAGLRATVYERASELKPLGAGITVQMNAMAALKTIGLDDAVAAEGESPKAASICDDAGRPLTKTRMDALQDELGSRMVCIHRGRLHRVLLGHAGDVVRTGRAVTGYREEGEQVVVELSDGSTDTADLLVGADGLRSVVRAKLLGDAPLRYSGYTSWRGVCANGGLVPPGEVKETWGRGARFGIVCIGHDEVYWFCTANAPAGERDPESGPHETLQRLFGGWHAPIPELLRRTPKESILRTDIHDRPPVKSWSRGRVTLLGDAAHPMTPNMGQGACQAIEDAVVLARCLAAASSAAGALQLY